MLVNALERRRKRSWPNFGNYQSNTQTYLEKLGNASQDYRCLQILVFQSGTFSEYKSEASSEENNCSILPASVPNYG